MAKGASLNPVDFITGGLLDDVDVTFKNVRFEMFNYGGSMDATPALGADLVTGAEGPQEAPYRQHWSCGSAESWEPSPDGKIIVPIGKDTALRQSTNAAFFFKALGEAGFPMERLNDGDVSVLEGLKCHVNRKDAPKRGNLPAGGTRTGRDGKTYEKDNKIMVVSKIHQLPWEGAQPKGKKAAKKEEAPQSTGDLDAKAKDVLVNLILQGGGSASKKDVPSKGFNLIDAKDPDKNKILGLLFKDAWIRENGFTLAEDGTITLA